MDHAQLAAWRKATRRTQTEAATFFGVQLRQYQRWEGGEVEIKPIYERLIEQDPKLPKVTP